MSDSTKIEWCDSTFNPWIGCTKVSPACDHCYAERGFDIQRKVVKWGAGQPRKRTSEKNWKLPEKWNQSPFYKCADCGWRGDANEVLPKSGNCDSARCPSCRDSVFLTRRRVFCASLADVFDNEVDSQWREDLWTLIEATPNLDWLLLTKRIGNLGRMIPDRWSVSLPKNIWLGASIVNQEEADRDIHKLLAVKTAGKRFLSMEPLLGEVDLADHLSDCDGNSRGLDWVIVGGESGPNARPMHPKWARMLRGQCEAAGVPFLFKQWGEWAPGNRYAGDDLSARDRTKIKSGFFTYSDAWNTGGPNPFRQTMDRIGKAAAGRELDGRTWDEYPA